MKKKTTLLSIASNFAIPTLIALLVIAMATIFAIRATPALYNNSGWPGYFSTLFDYSRYSTNHPARLAGQVISNLVAYAFIIGAVIICVLSFVLIKHDKKMKIKSAVVAVLLIIPSTIGLVGGFVNFFGEGLRICLNSGGKGAVCAFLLVLLFVFDFSYYVLAIIYLFNSIKTAVKVNRGELVIEEETEEVKSEEEEKIKKEELRAARRAQLLKDIRVIVREELERHGAFAVEKTEPEEQKEENNNKNPRAPRIQFAKKVVKADKDLQEKYNELKNEIMAYGPSSRLSVSGDTFRLHRKPYVKITLVGKSLKVYFALDPKDFVDSPIPVVDASDKNAYAEVPALLKVKSNLSLKRAKELVAQAFNRDGVARKENTEEVNYLKEIRAELRNNK